MRTIFIPAILLILSGCPKNGPTPEPRDTDWCTAAEQNLEKLQCLDRAGDPMWVNKKGERFAQMCETAQEEGEIFLNPKCVAGAVDCDTANQCPPTSESVE
jgi:hypothetical protein